MYVLLGHYYSCY